MAAARPNPPQLIAHCGRVGTGFGCGLCVGRHGAIVRLRLAAVCHKACAQSVAQTIVSIQP